MSDQNSMMTVISGVSGKVTKKHGNAISLMSKKLFIASDKGPTLNKC